MATWTLDLVLVVLFTGSLFHRFEPFFRKVCITQITSGYKYTSVEADLQAFMANGELGKTIVTSSLGMAKYEHTQTLWAFAENIV